MIEFEANFKLPIIGLLPILRRGKKFHDVILGEQGTAQDTHDLHDGASKFEVVLNDSDETVCNDGNMMNLLCYAFMCPMNRIKLTLNRTKLAFDKQFLCFLTQNGHFSLKKVISFHLYFINLSHKTANKLT